MFGKYLHQLFQRKLSSEQQAFMGEIPWGYRRVCQIQDKRVGSVESGVREGREREAGWMKGEVDLIYFLMKGFSFDR